MKVYTGNAFGAKLEKVIAHDLGIMISSSPTTKPVKEFRQVPCALDNGAYTAYKKGYPFPESTFLQMIDECYKLGIPLDFIVCPDIVAGGQRSLDLSMEWATGRLRSAPRLALVVQDGMTSEMIDTHVRSLFTHIFIGGTPNWKWRGLPGWQAFCHAFKLHCHVGSCGTLEKLRQCEDIGIDSVDSTNFTRNNSWDVIEQFRNDNLFTKGETNEDTNCSTRSTVPARGSRV
jgi:hypothetical protein